MELKNKTPHNFIGPFRSAAVIKLFFSWCLCPIDMIIYSPIVFSICGVENNFRHSICRVCPNWAFRKLLQLIPLYREKWACLYWLFPSSSSLPGPRLNVEQVALCRWAGGWQFCWLVWNMIGVATHDTVKYWWVTEGSRWSCYLLSVMSTDTRQLPSSMPHLPWQRRTP